MDPSELNQRVARGEDLHTEFKELLTSSDSLAAELVALANTDGGQLLIGVADDRTILSVTDPDAIARQVDNVANNNCEPPITVVQEVISHAKGTVVVVNVPKGSMRPYRTSRGRYYIRTTSGKRDASREELLRLFQASKSLFYDETPLQRVGLSEMNLDAFDEYLDRIAQPQLKEARDQVLENWSLVVDGTPTIAGILLFAEDPQRHLPFAQINAARFPGTDSSVEPSDRKDLRGRLLDILHQAEGFLNLHLTTSHRIRGFEPESRPELPKEIFREALVNAVAHRDYTIVGPVRLFIFDDRVEIHTPGRPPNTVTADAMRLGVHVVRNPAIYARLSDVGLVTRAGTGVRRIIRLVQETLGRDIGIEIHEHEVLMTIPRNTSNSL